MSDLAPVHSAFDAEGLRTSCVPKTIEQAIEAALVEIDTIDRTRRARGGSGLSRASRWAIIHDAVRDFLGTQFALATLEHRSIEELWAQVFPFYGRCSLASVTNLAASLPRGGSDPGVEAQALGSKGSDLPVVGHDPASSEFREFTSEDAKHFRAQFPLDSTAGERGTRGVRITSG